MNTNSDISGHENRRALCSPVGCRWIFLFLLAQLLTLAFGAEPQTFFRLTTSTNAAIVGFDALGFLVWSNAATTGTYLVERKSDLNAEGVWTPVTRNDFASLESTVRVYHPSPPEGFAFIPGGRFLMGDSMNDPIVSSVARPVRTVFVSPFFMNRFETTNHRMRDVLQYAYESNLISVTSTGVFNIQGVPKLLFSLGKYNSEIKYSDGVFSVVAGRANFPVVWMSWYGSAAYCNFLGAMEGKELCYDFTGWTCDFSKRGYRLPTEAEWEFAARGGHEAKRFPWGDSLEITHSRANYRSDTNQVYDVSPTRDFHPNWAHLRPRTSPVGFFPPNDYGLYDMAGNNWEWVWDYYARYPSSTQTNPTGPAPGPAGNRLFRGGSWFTKSERVTCAARYQADPHTVFDDFSFRIILPIPAAQ